jgi:methionyl-tRNA formyltransferase
MKITVFTSNQPRHISLARELASICDQLYCIQECNTVVPGQREDFYKKTDLMQDYFNSVMAAERSIFGELDFMPKNISSLAIKSGDLNFLTHSQLEPALNSDVYIVFGASYIKGWLIDFLVKNRALNIHMGLSPYYRGSSCNFWALYDEKPNFVGATIHLLTIGLDSGPMLYHCLPGSNWTNLFEYTMLSVQSAHSSLVARIADHSIYDYEPSAQIKSDEIRYSKNNEFTDDILINFNARRVIIEQMLRENNFANLPKLLNTFTLNKEKI